MEKYQGFEDWLITNQYVSWKTYLRYINTIDRDLGIASFEKIRSVEQLQQLLLDFQKTKGFSSKGTSDKSNHLSGFRTYIEYVTESNNSEKIKVWRIGSNWGGINVLPVFKEHSIAYAGKEVEENILKVNIGDIVAVTSGRSIVAVGKATGLVDLSSFNDEYATQYEDVKAISVSPFYFKENFPAVDFSIYDGQGKQFHEAHGNYVKTITHLFNRLKSINMNDQPLNILKFKKQIILQGPPGTGKTKLAKELAEELIPLTDDILAKLIIKGLRIKTVKGQVSYTIDEVDIPNKKVTLLREKNTPNTITFSSIINSYVEKRWLHEVDSNNDRMAVAVAKYIDDIILESSGQFTLIQFHPSYSYEDFVRGIVAESGDDRIEYKNVNKTLGLFAEKAKENWDDSRKDSSNISKENKTKEYFEMFADDLDERILGDELIKLTPKVNIIDVEPNAFRYKGNAGWNALGNRMLFKDIIQAFLDGNKVRQDIKKNKNLSGLAIQHASYFLRVLNMFQEYLKKNNLDFDQLDPEKVEPKNYVLIIDEINRANLSSVLGELIYALEYRGKEVESMYKVDGSSKLVLPENLYIIGTMNTADRSVGHIDYAIRRRFAFMNVMPKDLSKELGEKFHKPLFDSVATLFDNYLSPEFEKKDVQLGHSYFIDKAEEGGSMDIRLEYEIKPILFEYVKDGILLGETVKEEIKNLQP
jgi:hypothetical protein